MVNHKIEKNVLVTGGASFIGSHLVDSLLKRGATVRVADDFSSGRLTNLNYPLEHVEDSIWRSGDLTVYRGISKRNPSQG